MLCDVPHPPPHPLLVLVFHLEIALCAVNIREDVVNINFPYAMNISSGTINGADFNIHLS